METPSTSIGSMFPYQTTCPACGEPVREHGFVDGTTEGGRRWGMMVGFCRCPGLPVQVALMPAPEPGPAARALGEAIRDIRIGGWRADVAVTMTDLLRRPGFREASIGASVVSAWQRGVAVPEPPAFAVWCNALGVDPRAVVDHVAGGRPLLQLYEAARREVYGPDAAHGLHMCRTCGVRPDSWFDMLPPEDDETGRAKADHPFCGMCGHWGEW